MEGSVRSIAFRHGVPCPCGSCNSEKNDVLRVIGVASANVVTWAQAGMPMLLFFAHEGQPIVTHPRSSHHGLCFPGRKRPRGPGDPADLSHDEKSSDNDSVEGWRAPCSKSVSAGRCKSGGQISLYPRILALPQR